MAYHLASLDAQAEEMAAAGLDVDISALDKLIGPLPEPEPERGPGRIRIKERENTRRWDVDAKCQGMDTNIFYPTRHSTQDEMRAARDICLDCPVRWDCLAYSLLNWEKIGIWGGYTEIERRELRKILNHAIRTGRVDRDDYKATARYLAEKFAGKRRSIPRGEHKRHLP